MTISENDAARLVRDHPEAVSSFLVTSPDPVSVALVAERAGSVPAAAGELLALLDHASPIVREAAVDGLGHLVDVIRGRLERVAREDRSPAVREAADDVLYLCLSCVCT